MKDKKYYYDEQIKDFFYKEYMNSFIKVKTEMKDNTLVSLLALETKQGLIDVAKRVEIKGYSKLGKEALINHIAENIKSNIPKILESLSYKELIFLNEAVNNDVYSHTFQIDELSTVEALSSLGILAKLSINSKLNLIVADEVKEPLKKLMDNKDYLEDLKERSKAISFIDGLMIQYGMIDGAKLYELISNKHTDIIKKEDLDFYLNYIFRSYEVFTDTNSLVHPYLFSPEDIYAEINVRQTVPYDYDDVEYFINIAENIFSSYGSEIDTLKNCLIKRGVDKDLVDSVVTELIYYVKNNMGTMSIVGLLADSGVDFNNEKDADEIVKAVMEVYNNTHMWALKGLTPNEMEKRRKTTIVKKKEPGRNDPCPCGSGKKYKKCCGRR